MSLRAKSLFLFSFLTILYLFDTPFLHASTRVTDSINEFGERRFVHNSIQKFAERRFFRPMPARLKVGPVIVHPSLDTQVTFDNNIVNSSVGAEDDFVFDIIPGVVLEIPIDTHQVVVGYEADIEIFAKNDRQNDQNQNAFALVDLSFPNWYVNILERFRETSGRSGTTFTTRVPRYDQSINPKIGYRWKRMTFEQSFTHVLRDFRRSVDDALDYQYVDWSSVVYFDLFARLKALIEYKWVQFDYEDDFRRNGTINQIRLGLEGQVHPNISVDLRIGPQLRDYEEQERNDFNSWVGSLLVEYAPRENLIMEFEFDRTAIEATLAGSNYYKEHMFRLGADYEFMPRWTVFGDAKYARHDYSERFTSAGRVGFRRDHHMILGAGVRYDFRDWWDLELEYEYLRRDSNFSTFDYTNHRLSLTSSLHY